MNRRKWIGAGLAVVLLVGAYAGYRIWWVSPRGNPLAEGKEAPDFSLEDSSGTKHTLETLTANGPAVLIFYRGHW